MILNTNQTYDNIILGLGVTGMSVARFLNQQGEDFLVMDTRENPPGKDELFKLRPNAKLLTGSFDQDLLNSAKWLIVNPGLSVRQKPVVDAKKSGAKIIGDIELFARALKDADVKLIGITGSNGKSTVVSLVAAMIKSAGLKVYMGGNIGIPALDLLDKTRADVYLLELSSFQLETTESLMCDVAAILNISADHLDRYDNFNDYANAKQRLLKQTKAIVLLDDDRLLKGLAHDTNIKRIGFTKNLPDESAVFGTILEGDELWLLRGKQKLITASEIYLKSRHNVLNSLAALAIGFELGLPLSAMQQTLKEFKGLQHRTEFVRKKAGVIWINDSKGTNVGASIVAIESFAEKGQDNIILIAGGQGKQGDFASLAQAAKGRVRQAIVFGEDASLIHDVLGKATASSVVSNLEGAVALADSLAKKGDVVLFSPACASFDMFESYLKRGEHFIKLVESLV